MQQTTNPAYGQPSYEGLYYLKTNSQQKPNDIGYVERLLPNGSYIVTSTSFDSDPTHIPFTQDYNLDNHYFDNAIFFTNEVDRDMALERAMNAEAFNKSSQPMRSPEYEEIQINPDTGEIIGNPSDEQSAQSQQATDQAQANEYYKLVRECDRHTADELLAIQVQVSKLMVSIEKLREVLEPF